MLSKERVRDILLSASIQRHILVSLDNDYSVVHLNVCIFSVHYYTFSKLLTTSHAPFLATSLSTQGKDLQKDGALCLRGDNLAALNQATTLRVASLSLTVALGRLLIVAVRVWVRGSDGAWNGMAIRVGAAGRRGGCNGSGLAVCRC